jgi:hypothetical protein
MDSRSQFGHADHAGEPRGSHMGGRGAVYPSTRRRQAGSARVSPLGGGEARTWPRPCRRSHRGCPDHLPRTAPGQGHRRVHILGVRVTDHLCGARPDLFLGWLPGYGRDQLSAALTLRSRACCERPIAEDHPAAHTSTAECAPVFVCTEAPRDGVLDADWRWHGRGQTSLPWLMRPGWPGHLVDGCDQVCG